MAKERYLGAISQISYKFAFSLHTHEIYPLPDISCSDLQFYPVFAMESYSTSSYESTHMQLKED